MADLLRTEGFVDSAAATEQRVFERLWVALLLSFVRVEGAAWRGQRVVVAETADTP
jgi:hypothetical protein